MSKREAARQRRIARAEKTHAKKKAAIEKQYSAIHRAMNKRIDKLEVVHQRKVAAVQRSFAPRLKKLDVRMDKAHRAFVKATR